MGLLQISIRLKCLQIRSLCNKILCAKGRKQYERIAFLPFLRYNVFIDKPVTVCLRVKRNKNQNFSVFLVSVLKCNNNTIFDNCIILFMWE